MAVDDVVFATYKHPRWAIESVRCCELPTRNLHEKICSRISRFAPFSYDMVETEVELVIREHLRGEKF